MKKTVIFVSYLVLGPLALAQKPLTAQDTLVLAAKNRPSLRTAKLKVEQARLAASALGAYPPTLLSVGASTRNTVGATDSDLAITQPVDLFGRVRAGRATGEANVLVALAEFSAAASDLQTEVLTAFSEAVAAKHRSEVADDLLKIAESLFAATKRRVDEGKIADLQLTRAAIELERARQAAQLRRSDSGAAIKRLAGAMGSEPSDLAVQSDATIPSTVAPALEDRADLKLLRALVESAEADAGLARTTNRPELNLQLVRTAWGEEPGYVVGRVQLTWSLLDHGRARSEARSAKSRAEATRKLLSDTTDRAKAELAAIQLEREARESRIRSYEAILASARDLVAKSQKGFLEGFGTQIDVLEATRALREVEQEIVDARQQLALAVIAQYRATGFLSEVLK